MQTVSIKLNRPNTVFFWCISVFFSHFTSKSVVVFDTHTVFSSTVHFGTVLDIAKIEESAADRMFQYNY